MSATKNTCSYGAPANAMPLISRTALCAPSHPATHAAVMSAVVPSGCLSVADGCAVVLREADELGVPLHRDARLAQGVAQEPLVVVLAQDQDVRDTG